MPPANGVSRSFRSQASFRGGPRDACWWPCSTAAAASIGRHIVGPDGISHAVYLDNQSVDRKAFTQTGDGGCRADFDACYPLFHAYRPSGALRLPFGAPMRDATCTLTRWSHANCLRKAHFL